MDTRRFQPVVVPEPLSHDYHVMVKPIGGVCNLQCAYCYYLPTVDMYRSRAGHSGDFRMSPETYDLFAKQYLDRPIPRISFAWQGGEPTLMGLDWFNHAMEIQKKHTRQGQAVENSLQTNGTLLDDAWCDFLRKHSFLVGLSIDGPANYHDKYRRTPAGEPSHEKVQRGLKLLRKHGVEFNALVVLSQANVYDPDGVYRYLTNAGLRHVQLIPLLEYDRQTLQPIPQTITGQQYGRFLCRIFDLWFEHNISSIFVQIIEQTLAAHMGVSPSLCIHMPTCGRALILEHNGDLYACDHYPFPTHLRGNIHDRPLHEMVNSPEQLAFGRAKQVTLAQQCRQCPYLPACNGGCCKHRIVAVEEENMGEPGTGGQAPRPRSGSATARGTPSEGVRPLDDMGGLTPEEAASSPRRGNWFCEGYRMFFEHSFDRMAAIATALRRGLPPRSVHDQVPHSSRAYGSAPSTLRAADLPGPVAGQPASKIDRNNPCPCGSGLKYKKCCGRKG